MNQDEKNTNKIKKIAFQNLFGNDEMKKQPIISCLEALQLTSKTEIGHRIAGTESVKMCFV